MEILCRRSTTDDAIPVKLIIGDDYSAYEQLYGNYCIPQIIETSYFSVTATNADGDMLGFAAFSDFPCLTPQIPSDTWINFVYLHYKTENIHANNTLWLVFFAAKPEVADDVINNIFATLYSTLPDTDHVLFALYREAGPVSPISDYFSALPERAPTDVFQGDVLWSPREHVIPDLVIRKGKVEDYDDLMPLLLAEVGVLTEMGDDFYLEELLEHQDAVHCVLVAEDAETGEIVGASLVLRLISLHGVFVGHCVNPDTVGDMVGDTVDMVVVTRLTRLVTRSIRLVIWLIGMVTWLTGLVTQLTRFGVPCLANLLLSL